MRDDFGVIIISHGRPDCSTWRILREDGYTGKMLVLIDDEDNTQCDYLARYNDSVRVFHKRVDFDIGDNFNGPNGIATFARNEAVNVARREGFKYFLMMDDDLKSIRYRYIQDGRLLGRKIHDFDAILTAMVEYMESAQVDIMGFGGVLDYIGGVSSFVKNEGKPECYNGYLFRTDSAKGFKGRYTEDYIMLNEAWRDGAKIVCFTPIQMTFDVWQPQKQSKNIKGGCQGVYSQNSGYLVRYYGVMFAPASIKLKQGKSGDFTSNMNHCAFAPKIISDRHRKAV